MPRREKAGLKKPTPKLQDLYERVQGLTKKALDYLEAELDLLLQMPGNYDKVIRITRELAKLQPPAESGGAAAPEVRSGFALDLSDPVQEGGPVRQDP